MHRLYDIRSLASAPNTTHITGGRYCYVSLCDQPDTQCRGGGDKEGGGGGVELRLEVETGRNTKAG